MTQVTMLIATSLKSLLSLSSLFSFFLFYRENERKKIGMTFIYPVKSEAWYKPWQSLTNNGRFPRRLRSLGMTLFFVGSWVHGVIWVGRTLTSQPLPIDPIRTYGAYVPMDPIINYALPPCLRVYKSIPV